MTRDAKKLNDEINGLFFKLVTLTARKRQNLRSIARVKRTRESLLKKALRNHPEETPQWYQLKAFSCSRHSQSLLYLHRSYRYAKNKGALDEQMKAARFIAQDYAEMRGHRGQALKWLKTVDRIAADCKPTRRLKRWVQGVHKDIEEYLQEHLPSKTPPSPYRLFLPRNFIVPSTIKKLDGNCGPLIAWSVLSHFKKRVKATDIIESCAYVPGAGTHSIGIAVCLRLQGLEIAYHANKDPNPEPDELPLFAKAKALGIPVLPALTLDSLLEQVILGHVPIVCYKTKGSGHFAAITGIEGNKLTLHFGVRYRMTRQTFLKNWRAPGFNATCVLVKGRFPRQTHGESHECVHPDQK
jgi:hypothetical protein